VASTWKCKFLDLVGALKYEYEGKTTTYFWIDVFSINQHTPSEKHFEYWTNQFKDAFRRIGYSSVVLSPWYEVNSIPNAAIVHLPPLVGEDGDEDELVSHIAYMDTYMI
jgi:hypothetical protein